MQTPFTRHAGVAVPLICGPMYPCSNPELVAAVSEAGGLGVVQPIALTYVHGHELRAGLRHIRSLTARPVGFNALIEASSRTYLDRMRLWIDVALEEGLRFFITSLGDPRWVCERVHAVGGVVYHDVTEARWARKAVDAGADGLIAVNARAGGHAGSRDAQSLLEELQPFGLPVVAAGGVGTPEQFAGHLKLGYVAAQLGTRFIATAECRASNAYKQAILQADAADIVLVSLPTPAVVEQVLIGPDGLRTGRAIGIVIDTSTTGPEVSRRCAQALSELDFAELGRARGWPEPDRQVVMRTARGRHYLDVRFNRYHTICEVNGVQHYEGSATIDDALRRNAHAIGGGTALEIPAVALILDPDPLLDQVEQALRRGGWVGPTGQSG